MKKPIIVWDLDGTLADGTHRLHLLPTRDKHLAPSWDEFNLACLGDKPIEDNLMLMRCLERQYYNVILTGRSAVAYDLTWRWLRENNAAFQELIMRPADDNRPDIVFKEEVLRKLGLEQIQCCFDDAEHVVRHIRSLGLTCHQVTHYDNPLAHVLPQESE